MSAKAYEEYILLRRSVETLMGEHDKLVELADSLKSELTDVRKQLEEKKEEVKELQTRYERARFSGVLLGSQGEGEDASMAKRRVSELVREIDKCIALLDR